MKGDVYLSRNVRYRPLVHLRHEDQIGPDAPKGYHYCGAIIEHRTKDPDYDGRPGHVSFRQAGWCPGAVKWCSDAAEALWTLESFKPLTLSPSVQCTTHPEEFHVFVRNGKVA